MPPEIQLATADRYGLLLRVALTLDEYLAGLLNESLVLLRHLAHLRHFPLIVELGHGHRRRLENDFGADVEGDLLDFDIVPFFFARELLGLVHSWFGVGVAAAGVLV